ncbi:hypothetical protein GCM10027589_04720 [Actinocorallia lasiicapitis]
MTRINLTSVPPIPARLVLDLHATGDMCAAIVYETGSGYRVALPGSWGGVPEAEGRQLAVLFAEELHIALAAEQGVTAPAVTAPPTEEWAQAYAAGELAALFVRELDRSTAYRLSDDQCPTCAMRLTVVPALAAYGPLCLAECLRPTLGTVQIPEVPTEVIADLWKQEEADVDQSHHPVLVYTAAGEFRITSAAAPRLFTDETVMSGAHLQAVADRDMQENNLERGYLLTDEAGWLAYQAAEARKRVNHPDEHAQADAARAELARALAALVSLDGPTNDPDRAPEIVVDLHNRNTVGDEDTVSGLQAGHLTYIASLIRQDLEERYGYAAAHGHEGNLR